ncbi:MAG: exo-alpha-sialidase [Actinophytocola sp.]|uniref:sialidase family protein n=1 Tax=Actinophytocola sp. TaxID=1872138 RepID=UPI001326FACA|nr:sialidase family protein [Actinophytocola sp.]MPZ83665.1 exo-alpha-sialidase [Actinophytocola sp.]
MSTSRGVIRVFVHGWGGVVSGLVGLALVAGVAPAVAAPGAETPRRELIYPGGAGYPRVIRLSHSGPANGRVLATVGSVSNGNSVGIILESTDGGTSFQQVGTVSDPEGAAGRGMCCGTLFELPRAVGAMPEGTLRRATTAGYKVPEGQRHTKQRLWQSRDLGRTWSFLSDIATSPNQYNAWEPELSVATDGQLVVHWADESDKPDHDQKIVQVRSEDGIHWTDQRDTVKNGDFFVRPGMPGVRQLSDGTYFMVYEVCNLDEPLCSAYFRTSTDGWDYGDPLDLGAGIRTADGKYPRHTPTITVSPDGAILLAGEMLVNADGSHAPGNGRTLLVNEDNGEGPWRETPAPVDVPDPNNEACRNFSPSILASEDGTEVLHVATDTVDGVCKAFFATGPVPRPS